MKTSVVLLLILMFMLPLITVPINPVGATSKTITVPTDYPTIQEAIDNANAGDTVFVKKGTHQAGAGLYGILIEKPISLIGEDRQTTIIETPVKYRKDVTIQISADNVTVSGFTINGNGVICIRIEDNYMHVPIGCRIVGNNIRNGSWGIIAYGSTSTLTGEIKYKPSYLNIADNKITDNNIDALYISTSNTTISGNTLSGNTRCGIMIDSAVHVTVTGNTISNNGADSEENFRGGISMGWWGPFNVYQNTITDNKGSGINFKEFCNNCTIRGNTIAKNDVGIAKFLVQDGGKGNIVYQNNFVDNKKQAAMSEKMYATATYSEVDAVALDNGQIGNYWSDYVGSGVYRIDENNTDHYPQTQAIDTSGISIPEYSLGTIQVMGGFLLLIVVSTVLAVYSKKFKGHSKA